MIGLFAHEIEGNSKNLEAVAKVCGDDLIKGCRARKVDVVVGAQHPVPANLSIDARAGKDRIAPRDSRAVGKARASPTI
jgi:hypothetical protein